MDINMPVLDGYSATVQIRKVISSAQTKIVAASAYHSSIVEDMAIESGMNYSIAKPIVPNELARVV